MVNRVRRASLVGSNPLGAWLAADRAEFEAKDVPAAQESTDMWNVLSPSASSEAAPSVPTTGRRLSSIAGHTNVRHDNPDHEGSGSIGATACRQGVHSGTGNRDREINRLVHLIGGRACRN
jgi:hypothetical protein